MLWYLLTACSEFGLGSVEPPGPPPVVVPVVERYVQAPLSQVDLLFVIDDTASMELELDALAASLPELLDTLDASGMDWQIGVVDAQEQGPWPGYLLGSPFVLTPVHPEPQVAFSERLPEPGGTGESGLGAAILALELAAADGPNAGFRRSGAVLQVLFVSDADDQSVGEDPVGDFLAQLELSSGERMARVSALAGDVPGGCASPSGSAQAGFRYLDVVQATGGRFGSICDIDFGDLLTDLADDSVELPLTFPIRSEPIAGSVAATVDGTPAPFQYDSSSQSVVFDQAPISGAVVEIRYAVRRE